MLENVQTHKSLKKIKLKLNFQINWCVKHVFIYSRNVSYSICRVREKQIYLSFKFELSLLQITLECKIIVEYVREKNHCFVLKFISIKIS